MGEGPSISFRQHRRVSRYLFLVHLARSPVVILPPCPELAFISFTATPYVITQKAIREQQLHSDEICGQQGNNSVTNRAGGEGERDRSTQQQHGERGRRYEGYHRLSRFSAYNVLARDRGCQVHTHLLWGVHVTELRLSVG